MEWRVVARPLVVKRGRRTYEYAEVRILLPPEYAGFVFEIRPIGRGEARPIVEEARVVNEEKPTWISEAVRDVFKPNLPSWISENPWVDIIRRRGP